MAKDPDRNITAYRSGYMVRFNRGGERTQTTFGAKAHGGWHKALKAAKKFRDSEEKRLGPAATTKGIRYSNNKTGRPNLAYVKQYDCWRAIFDGSTQRRTVSFSCGKWGKRKAKALASLALDLETTDRDAILKAYSKKSGR